MTNSWRRLNPVGIIPSKRAAHSTCKIDQNELLMFGGAFVGGKLAKAVLYHLKVEGMDARWNEIAVQGEAPS
jgi:hypothetical protein